MNEPGDTAPLPLLSTIEAQTGGTPRATVMCLHGVGGDGHQFAALLAELARALDVPIRFVCPNAPYRAVTLCGGERMRAWYDLRDTNRQLQQDEPAIRASSAAVRALIDREAARGIPSNRLVLIGFSQGGSMALFTGTRLTAPLAGIVALSCYPLLAASFAAERQAANQHTPILLAHGLADPVINVRIGEEMRDGLLASGYPIAWHAYPVGHEFSAEEVTEIASFVGKVLTPRP